LKRKNEFFQAGKVFNNCRKNLKLAALVGSIFNFINQGEMIWIGDGKISITSNWDRLI
jgi:hypothetical protein